MFVSVAELQEYNLYQLMKDKDKPFSEAKVRNWCFQMLQALAYMHKHGYFHRDLKPGVFLTWIQQSCVSLKANYIMQNSAYLIFVFLEVFILVILVLQVGSEPLVTLRAVGLYCPQISVV